MSALLETYHRLYDRFGPQHWWPGETPLEIMVGAVLTQNTSWANVSRAIDNLRAANLLELESLAAAPAAELAALIRPAGYYNLKAARLANLLRLITNDYHGDLQGFLTEETGILREKLLAVKGVGPETADSILLYAAGRPVFVVDAYTHRIFSRHSLIAEDDDYHAIQEHFMSSLPEDVRLFNEYHALIVRLGKEFCRKRQPLCSGCPLEETKDG